MALPMMLLSVAQVVEDVPSIKATVDGLAALLRGDGHDPETTTDISGGCDGVLVVGHSLGTTAAAWLLHDPRTRHLVASTVLLGEPACTQVTH